MLHVPALGVTQLAKVPEFLWFFKFQSKFMVFSTEKKMCLQYNQCLFKFAENSWNRKSELLHGFIQLSAPKGHASVNTTKDSRRSGVYLVIWFHPPMGIYYTQRAGELLHESKAQAAPSNYLQIYRLPYYVI